MRVIAFGDLGAGIWGVAWGGFAALGTLEAAAAVTAELDGDRPAEPWTWSCPGVELELAAIGEPASFPDGFDQLCRARGRFELAGAEYVVDCLGRRGARDGIDASRFESVRDLSAWFEPDQGLALRATRPRGEAGQEGDLVSAAVFEAGAAATVADPRLSTTYSSTGAPARAGLELWLVENDEDQYPHRAAGQAAGPRVVSEASGAFAVDAGPFRWYSRGLEGAGIYVLARAR
jgi:hypothetical protein